MDSLVKTIIAGDVSFSIWWGGGGTGCSDPKMLLVPYGVKNDHACLGLDLLKWGVQLSVWNIRI